MTALEIIHYLESNGWNFLPGTSDYWIYPDYLMPRTALEAVKLQKELDSEPC